MPLTPEQIAKMNELTGLQPATSTSKKGASRFAELQALSGQKPSIRQSFNEALLTPKQETPASDFMGANVAKTAVDYGTEMVKNPVETAKGVVKGVPGGAAQFTKLIDTGVNKALGKEGTTLDYSAIEELTQPSNKAQQGGYVVGTALPIERAVTAATPLVKAGVEAVETGLKIGGEKISTAFDRVLTLPNNLSKKAMDFISADPEKKVVTMLKESKPEELDNYLSIAEKATSDPRVATPFEVVGNKLADTTKILQTRLNEIGKAKSDIIQPLREGFDSFKKQTTPLINKLTSLKNSFGEIEQGSKSKVQAIINDAKTISTKLDADTFIDKVQNMLYSGNIDMTIPRGSSLDKQLRGIIGEYNSSLKSSLPKEYADLNDKYSKLIDSLDTVNRSLGEVVEGVPVRGASLIKQFFSPSGTKAKEMFEFIKKETNGEVDLAKDATLAKFAMDLFEDPRARSLLSGIGDIPTSVSGAVSKVLEKVGGEKLQETMRASTIRKAKETTKPSFKTGTVPKTVKAFSQSQKIKDIGNFTLGTFGRNAFKRKELNVDRFPEEELGETLKNIKKKYRASLNNKSYRKDNIAWVSEMPNGEKRIVYTRLNEEGKEEIINWHKVSNDTYIKDLSKNGVPERTRTSNPFVRTE